MNVLLPIWDGYQIYAVGIAQIYLDIVFVDLVLQAFLTVLVEAADDMIMLLSVVLACDTPTWHIDVQLEMTLG